MFFKGILQEYVVRHILIIPDIPRAHIIQLGIFEKVGNHLLIFLKAETWEAQNMFGICWRGMPAPGCMVYQHPGNEAGTLRVEWDNIPQDLITWII